MGKNVCDKQVYDPTEDDDEQIFWRKWQAPMLLVMKPSLYQPYEAVMEWERRDAVGSAQLLEHFAQHYVLHLEAQLSEAMGEATLELAKHPKPMETSTADNNLQQKELPRKTGETSYGRSNSRRDARKLDTQAKYKNWQKAYRELKKGHPNMSDVWYSQRIAKLDVAKGQSAETVRKHMKK